MNKHEKLTENLTLWECIKSDTAIQLGIDNTPTEEALKNIKLWAVNIFQPIRDHFGAPIGLNSMYRCPELNSIIGGAKGSQHTKGQAGDIDADRYPHPHINNGRIFNFIKGNLDFDQLIIYNDKDIPDFVHVSYNEVKNRREIFFKDKLGYHRIE